MARGNTPGERILAPRRAEVGERGEREERLRGEIVQGKPQRWGAQPGDIRLFAPRRSAVGERGRGAPRRSAIVERGRGAPRRSAIVERGRGRKRTGRGGKVARWVGGEQPRGRGTGIHAGGVRLFMYEIT